MNYREPCRWRLSAEGFVVDGRPEPTVRRDLSCVATTFGRARGGVVPTGSAATRVLLTGVADAARTAAVDGRGRSSNPAIASRIFERIGKTSFKTGYSTGAKTTLPTINPAATTPQTTVMAQTVTNMGASHD